MSQVTIDRDKLIAAIGEQAKQSALNTTDSVMDWVLEVLKMAAREGVSIWEVVGELPGLTSTIRLQIEDTFDQQWTASVEKQLNGLRKTN